MTSRVFFFLFLVIHIHIHDFIFFMKYPPPQFPLFLKNFASSFTRPFGYWLIIFLLFSLSFFSFFLFLLLFLYESNLFFATFFFLFFFLCSHRPSWNTLASNFARVPSPKSLEVHSCTKLS